MEINSKVWIKNKESKKNAGDGFWSVATIISKNVDENGTAKMEVCDESGSVTTLSSTKGFMEMPGIEQKNAELDEKIENLIELTYLNEPEILNSLKVRYFARMIYTYTGDILIAINPLDAIIPDPGCEKFLEQFANEIKTAAVCWEDDGSSNAEQSTTSGGGEDFLEGENESVVQAAAAAAKVRKNHHSIILSGESGSGKTECAKLLTMYLINGVTAASTGIINEDIEDGDLASPSGLGSASGSFFPEEDAMMLGSPDPSSKSATAAATPTLHSQKNFSPRNKSSSNGSNGMSAYQLSTIEHIRQVTPIIEAFGNACTSHTHNSSRMGKYLVLSFSDQGELVGGNIRAYLLEHVRVTKQLQQERNFHIFYQVLAGATEEERQHWVLQNVNAYNYANQGGVGIIETNSINDKTDLSKLKAHFSSLGFDAMIVSKILEIVAGVLHLGQLEFSSVSALEGQTAQIIDKLASIRVDDGAPAAGADADDASTTSNSPQTELAVAARLLSLPEEELARSLTVRSVLLNREVFKKALTPLQALTARDAIAKSVYRKLFQWLISEINIKLQPLQAISPGANSSSVGILDIFGFDSFAVNSFEQLCINYANEALQQHFSQHMFKLELLEYKREGIPFEDISFPDNQESLDCIQTGIFKVLDDQCRIPNATDKRFASQLYKDLSSLSKFDADAAEKAVGHFRVEHFAGPVVYDTDKFIEKNLDNLPQDAEDLLGSSKNFALSRDTQAQQSAQSADPESQQVNAASTSAAGDGDIAPPPPTMEPLRNRVMRPSMPPGSGDAGAGALGGRTATAGRGGRNASIAPKFVGGISSPPPTRRGSVGGGSRTSVVAQIRSELAVMMADISSTVPHFVCCITPVERTEVKNLPASSSSEKSPMGESSTVQFQENRVASQLRYGGILEAVKVARTGLPNRFRHLDFFRRYRCIANPSHPAVQRLAVHVSKIDKSDDEAVKEQCMLLIMALTSTNSTPVQVNELDALIVKELQVIVRKRSVNKWMSSIGGVISDGGAMIGLTKVFLDRHTHSVLEICLFHQYALCRSKIGSMIMVRIQSKRYKKTVLTIHFLLRHARGMLARCRARKLRRDRQRALEKQEEYARLGMKEDHQYCDMSNLGAELREFKRQDLELQEQVTRLVSKSKVPEEAPTLRLDMSAVKKELLEKAGKFAAATVISTKVVEVHDMVQEGYMLLRPEKLIPRSALGKAFMGRTVKTENRASAVKAANKVITKDHGIFKAFFKVMEKLRELFELSRQEKDALEAQKSGGEAADIEAKISAVERIAKLSRTTYQYYHQYILKMVAEYGYDSKYRVGFDDENKYLLAFLDLLEARQPILDCEKTGKQPDPSSVFPLYVPPDAEQRGPNHQGYLPLCTTDDAHFKVVPNTNAPGVEFAVNSLQRLLKGRLTMYSIKYLKIIGKSSAIKGKESYYQVSKYFGAQSLASINAHGGEVFDEMDFSTIVLTSILTGMMCVDPEHLMVETPASPLLAAAAGETTPLSASAASVSSAGLSLRGFNMDMSLRSHVFKYPAAEQPVDESVLNILYLMPQMDAAMPKILAKALSVDSAPHAIVSGWLREMHLQNKRFASLKNAGFLPADYQALNLPISLPPGSVGRIFDRLRFVGSRIRTILAEGKSITHSDLLALVNPALGERYAEMRIQYRESSSSYLALLSQVKSKYGSPTTTSSSGGGGLSVSHVDTFTAHVDEMAVEFMRALDFSKIKGLGDEYQLCSLLFENLSFLPTLHLRSINVDQYSMFFAKLVSTARKAASTQSRLKSVYASAQAAANTPPNPNPNPPTASAATGGPPVLHTGIRHVVLSGLDKVAIEEVPKSRTAVDLQRELRIKLSMINSTKP